MFYIGYITCKDSEESKKIAEALLQEKLVACANIVDEINTMYWWKDEIKHGTESLLLVKTNKSKINEIIEKVRGMHSYDIACIEFIPIENINKEYGEWVEEVLE